jgi:hypothetical protein
MSGRQISALALVACVAIFGAFFFSAQKAAAPAPEESAAATSTAVLSATSSTVQRKTAPVRGPVRPQTASSTPITPEATEPAAQENVSLEIVEPDGTSKFQVVLHSGDDLCDNLIEAKSEGKIRSLTFDDSYFSTLHSLYVEEINGYENDWTFTVNGAEPEGCSLYKPKSGDTIIWTYGNATSS